MGIRTNLVENRTNCRKTEQI